MRQGGMKPKSHSSGTYWVRANANSGKISSDDDKGEPSLKKITIILLGLVFIVCALAA